MNLPTIIVAFIVAMVFISIVAKGIINRKKGKSSCSCGCNGCAMAAECHKKNR